MKKIVLFTMLAFLIQTSATAESLQSIVVFAKDICDDIIDEVGVDGKISRKQIEAKLEGSIGTVAKLIGAKLGVNGKLHLDETTYSGLPYEDLPGELRNSRECRQNLAVMLIEQSKKTCGVELYYKKRSINCGIESYKKARSVECGIESTTVGADDGGCSRCGTKCTEWGGRHGECHEDKHTWRDGFKIKSRTGCSMYCSKYSECRHQSHGVELYQECRHPDHGVEKYKACD